MNDTRDIQLIQVMIGEEYQFYRVAFLGERVLFGALLGSVLDIYSLLSSLLSNGAKSRQIDCQSLQVNEYSNFARASH